MTYALETIGLTKVFNGYRAVDGLNLKVPEGSIYGFLGPNGAGKTTTLKMLTGLSRPTSGTIRVFGREMKFGNLNSMEEFGFLPDVPNYYDWMTPRQFLTFSGELFSVKPEVLQERIDRLLELVGLADVKKKIGGFSRGMKQRLGIAQALINQPKIVFLDEPTSALDPIGRKEVMDIIAQLAGKVTVFFSTHILSDVERVCDRVIILDKGKRVLEDAMENLHIRYSQRILSIETEAGKIKETLMQALKECSWVEAIEAGPNGEVKVKVREMKEALRLIPKLLGEKGLPLKKFSVLEPTLEDIFMKVVAQV